MRFVLLFTALVVVCLTAPTWGEDKEDKKMDNQTFATKAAAAGLAEVNIGNLAIKRASNESVKKFASKMVEDHTKANRELIDLANKKGLRLATTMDEDHRKMSDQLTRLSGMEFDREYMKGQVKDHEDAVSLFEKASKNARDEDLRSWAKKTLPGLKDHLKMARDVRDKLKKKDSN